MQIKFEGEIETDLGLQLVFKSFKQIMTDNLQNYRLSMSNDTETLRDKYSIPIIKEVKVEEIKQTDQIVLG